MRILLSLLIFVSPMLYANCNSPEFDQFDFWLGQWQVTANGKIAGTNQIKQDLNNCVLHEHYQTPSGYEGRSLNIYDANQQRWHQTWVDNQGLLLQLDGRWNGQQMQLDGYTLTNNGEKHLHRISWTPNMDGSVRQHWQVSKDAGKTWSSLFDGHYQKRQPDQQ
ncbi:hypothetical protein [Bowmanella denitrificans]|uniref:hypothetical protein n=1 Tax=Bowmanella denitrificans TaxID=366582 RepID=UPI000C9AFD0C|nr:hypothetical protein [Bowmanella denitrificans]